MCMLSPKTPEELAQAMEVLVASYLVEVRRVAQQALDEAFARAVSKPSVAKVRRPHGARTRRGSEALAELADKLLARVCSQPGEGIAVYAKEMGVPARSLQRPMAKLRSAGQIRCVGERRFARYFPTVFTKPGR